jgi:hypothetical protein
MYIHGQHSIHPKWATQEEFDDSWTNAYDRHWYQQDINMICNRAVGPGSLYYRYEAEVWYTTARVQLGVAVDIKIYIYALPVEVQDPWVEENAETREKAARPMAESIIKALKETSCMTYSADLIYDWEVEHDPIWLTHGERTRLIINCREPGSRRRVRGLAPVAEPQ